MRDTIPVQLTELLKLLCDHEVEFIVVGGIAAVFHGSARSTQDVDIVYLRNKDNIRKLATALKQLDPYLRDAPPGLPFTLDAETIESGLNFTLTTQLGLIDLFGEVVGGEDYQSLSGHTMVVDFSGLSVKAVDLETLIKLKIAAGRPKDFDAIAELKTIAQESNADE